MENPQIAAALDEIADLLEFKGENPFRVRAYRNAGRLVRDQPESIARSVGDPDRPLTSIRGIGKDLAEKITQLVEQGRIDLLDELRAEIPASVMLLMRIPGLGPKKAAALYKELGVQSLDALREACLAHRVRELKGFGEKTEEAILAGIPFAATTSERIYWSEADRYVQSLVASLAVCPAAGRIAPAGSYRRGRETVADVDLLVESSDPAAVMDHFERLPEVVSKLGRGDTKLSVRLEGGLQVDLRVVPTESFGAALQYFTGSKDHNVVLRGLAKSRGLRVNEYGVFRVADRSGEAPAGEAGRVAGRTEEDVYAALGLPWIPPELREARREFEWAAHAALPELITVDDLRGDLHMHTTESDGKATLEQMAAAAQARGLEYIAITDHSPRVSMANGLGPDRLRRQWAAIDRLNDRLTGFVVLKGVEVDILEGGGLDLPDDVLAEADWVVASVHYGQRQPRAQITARITGALAHPSVAAIAHPTGRIINRRLPYEVDLEAVCQAAVRHGKLLELNANPARLDLDDVACAAAKAHGIPIVISSDAHSAEGLDVTRYGILQARRAGLTKADVANTRSWSEVKRLLGRGD